VISPTLRPLTDNQQHSQETDIHDLDGEPGIPASKRPQTHALDHTAAEIGEGTFLPTQNKW